MPPLGTGHPLLFPFSPGSARGCKGRSPLHKNNLKSPPLPTGKSALRARAGGWGQNQSERRGRQAARKAAPSQGSANARRAGETGASPPLGTCLAGVISAAWVQARGCKGRSPLHKKTKNLPLPRRGRGSGGWGAESNRKAGLAGEKESTPPQGTCTADSVSAASGLMQGCRGRSPRRN